MKIEERVMKSTSDEQAFEQLLSEYRPFIAACAKRTVGRYIDEHDDEMSIAIIAFSEAARRFKPDSGKFLNYASSVIRCRLIDELRVSNRTIKTVSMNADVNDDKMCSKTYADTLSCDACCDDPVRLEIDALTSVLMQYGFSFVDIAKCSPKHLGTKTACATAARCILEHGVLLEQLKLTKQMPVKKTQAITGISRKTIERHRNYIVCLVEMLSGDYVYLAEYAKFVKEAKIQ